jgi:hypothetical protein
VQHPKKIVRKYRHFYILSYKLLQFSAPFRQILQFFGLHVFLQFKFFVVASFELFGRKFGHLATVIAI